MSSIAIYNPSAVVANQVTSYVTSVHTPDYSSVTYKVINPDLSSVTGQPMKWWKVTGGNTVELMSSGEQATVDANLLPTAKENRKNYLQSASVSLLGSQGYTSDIRQNLQSMYTDSIRIKPNRATYLQPLIDWFTAVDAEVKNKQDAVDAATTLAAIAAIELDTATLIASDPHKTLGGALGQSDSTSLSSFLDENAEVTDPDTGVVGPFYLMQSLEHRRDLYNDSENPLYLVGHTPLLGVTGILSDHANRVLNLELIHAKYGWHTVQILEASYKRPRDLLIYYGYPNSFNSGTHAWYNEKVAQDMAQYSLIVLGDGVEDSSHPDYSNTQIIVPRIKALNPNAQIFGYVAALQTLGNFQTKTDQWDTLQVHGVFIDEAGYDYGKTRAEFNAMVDYVHGKTYAKLCFANAWNTDNILGTADDASFPNSTYNPGAVESHLTSTDWILLESLSVNTTAYSGNAGYESKTDWYVRCQKIISLRATYGVNFAASCVINNGNVNGQALFNFSFISSLSYNMEAVGSSDTGYAASSAAVTWWTRPDVSGMGRVWSLSPSVQVDTLDADVYHRYTDTAKLSLDFSTGAQVSGIAKR